MEVYINTIITSVIAFLGFVVWLVRLEGKISTESELRKALQDRLDGFERRISDTLDRIEQKIDAKQDK